MKKKLVVCFALVLLLFSCNVMSVFAEEMEEITQEELQFIEETTTMINTDLWNNNTFVEYELNSLIEEVNDLGADGEEYARRLEEIRDEYLYEYDEVETVNMVGFGFVRIRILRIAVASIIAWFRHKGCYLAAELLTFAKYNNDTSTEYIPYYGYIVKNTSGYSDIISKEEESDSYTFESRSGKYNADAYYSLHTVNYEKEFDFDTNGDLILTQLNIADVYDFNYSRQYSGIAGAAVNTMYIAQRVGVITPYNVLISIEVQISHDKNKKDCNDNSCGSVCGGSYCDRRVVVYKSHTDKTEKKMGLFRSVCNQVAVFDIGYGVPRRRRVLFRL